MDKEEEDLTVPDSPTRIESLKPSKGKNPCPRFGKRNPTILERRKVLLWIKNNPNESISEYARKVNVSRNTIRLWMSTEDAIMKQSNAKTRRRLAGGGRKSEIHEQEHIVVSFIKECDKAGKPVTIEGIKDFMKHNFQSFNSKTDHAITSWISRFLQRHKLAAKVVSRKRKIATDKIQQQWQSLEEV